MSRKRALSTKDGSDGVQLISEAQLQHLFATESAMDSGDKEMLQESFDRITRKQPVEKKSFGFFSRWASGDFRQLVKAHDNDKLKEDLQDFNGTIGVICALVISFTYSFNLGGIAVHESNFFAFCQGRGWPHNSSVDADFEDQPVANGQAWIGVVNYVVLLFALALLAFSARAYMLLRLLPREATRIFTELVGQRHFVDMTQFVLGAMFLLLHLEIALYALVVFPWLMGCLLIVFIQIPILVCLQSMTVIHIDKQFFASIVLSGIHSDPDGRHSICNKNATSSMSENTPSVSTAGQYISQPSAADGADGADGASTVTAEMPA